VSEESRELGDIGCFFDRDRKMMCHLQAGYDGENGPLNKNVATIKGELTTTSTTFISSQMPALATGSTT